MLWIYKLLFADTYIFNEHIRVFLQAYFVQEFSRVLMGFSQLIYT